MDIPCSWNRRHDVKKAILSNLIYRFSAIPVQTQVSYFVDVDTLILSFTWKERDLG